MSSHIYEFLCVVQKENRLYKILDNENNFMGNLILFSWASDKNISQYRLKSNNDTSRNESHKT